VAAVYAHQYTRTVRSLTLLAPAIVRTPSIPHSHSTIKEWVRRIVSVYPFVFLREAYIRLNGSRDYSESSQHMRLIMKRVISEDLTSFLPDITSPVCLVWGDEDRYTPITQSQIIKTGLKQTPRMIQLRGVNHGVHIHAVGSVVEAIDEFIREVHHRRV